MNERFARALFEAAKRTDRALTEDECRAVLAHVGP
jgi:predicted metalloprotease with PDZ domain